MFATAQIQPTRVTHKETGKLWCYFWNFIEFTTVCALCYGADIHLGIEQYI